jgi:hypothetical protein
MLVMKRRTDGMRVAPPTNSTLEIAARPRGRTSSFSCGGGRDGVQGAAVEHGCGGPPARRQGARARARPMRHVGPPGRRRRPPHHLLLPRGHAAAREVLLFLGKTHHRLIKVHARLPARRVQRQPRAPEQVLRQRVQLLARQRHAQRAAVWAAQRHAGGAAGVREVRLSFQVVFAGQPLPPPLHRGCRQCDMRAHVAQRPARRAPPSPQHDALVL